MILGFEEFQNLTVLYADDDEELQKTVTSTLKLIFGKVYSASTGTEAIKFFKQSDIHIAILDIRMGFVSGLEVAKEIRKTDKTLPIFMTSSYTETKDLLEACELNLVTYLKKPFSFDDLKEALFKCLVRLKDEGFLLAHLSDTLVYNPLQKVILKENEIISLSHHEIKLLTLLLKHRGQIVTYETLKNYIEQDLSDGALKNIVMRLRKKLGDDKLITNLSKIGYTLL